MPNVTSQDNNQPSFYNDEAKLLSALMWSPHDDPITSTTIEYLSPSDFFNPLYGQLFSVVKDLHSAGTSWTPATINSELGKDDAHEIGNPEVLRSLLVDITTLDAPTAQTAYLADEILGASYRRQFEKMAVTLQRAADHGPADRLFDIMIEHGKYQRQAKNRFDGFKPALAEARKQLDRSQHTSSRNSESTKEQNKERPADKPAIRMLDVVGVSTTSVPLGKQSMGTSYETKTVDSAIVHDSDDSFVR